MSELPFGRTPEQHALIERACESPAVRAHRLGIKMTFAEYDAERMRVQAAAEAHRAGAVTLVAELALAFFCGAAVQARDKHSRALMECSIPNIDGQVESMGGRTLRQILSCVQHEDRDPYCARLVLSTEADAAVRRVPGWFRDSAGVVADANWLLRLLGPPPKVFITQLTEHGGPSAPAGPKLRSVP